MPDQRPKQPNTFTLWEQRLRQAGESIEIDLRRVVTYINDEVVPDIRRHGSKALRGAATELERLAKRMNDAQSSPPSPVTRNDA